MPLSYLRFWIAGVSSSSSCVYHEFIIIIIRFSTSGHRLQAVGCSPSPPLSRVPSHTMQLHCWHRWGFCSIPKIWLLNNHNFLFTLLTPSAPPIPLIKPLSMFQQKIISITNKRSKLRLYNCPGYCSHLWEHQPCKYGRRAKKVLKSLWSLAFVHFYLLFFFFFRAGGKIKNLTIVNCNVEKLYGDIFRTNKITKLVIRDTPIRFHLNHQIGNNDSQLAFSGRSKMTRSLVWRIAWRSWYWRIRAWSSCLWSVGTIISNKQIQTKTSSCLWSVQTNIINKQTNRKTNTNKNKHRSKQSWATNKQTNTKKNKQLHVIN